MDVWQVPVALIAHGACMAAAWLLLAPLGALLARFGRRRDA